MTARGEEQSKSEYQNYCDHCEQLEKARSNSATLFDKYSLAGVGGAIALSLTLLGIIGKHPKWPVLIIISWLLLLIAAGSVLLNFHLSYKAHTKAIENAGEAYKKSPNDYQEKYWELEKEDNLPKWIERLNLTTLIAIIIGVICLLFFGGVNLC